MFKSTTIRLTGWYLAVIMTLSIVFSAAIYNITTNEVQARIEHFQTNIEQSGVTPPKPFGIGNYTKIETAKAKSNLSLNLLYVNIIIFIAGGFISYYLARHSLKPIEKAHEEESRFTSDASHELRTPLAVMKTEIEVALRDKSASTQDLRDILSSNLEEVDKLSKLAEMLLNLSRLDTVKLKMKSTNIADTTRDIIKELKVPADRIQLTASKKIIANCNEPAISDLIKVLIENALQYSPKDSLVSINISTDEKNATFEIINTGHGIEADKLPHIFERFYRADSSRTGGEQKGYGLGLSLAKRIIDMHNGKLTVSSELEHATIFTFEVPIAYSV